MGAGSTHTHENFTVHPGRGGTTHGPWQDMNPPPDDATATAPDTDLAGRSLNELVDDLAVHTYTGEDAAVAMPDVTGMREALRAHPGESVTADLGGYLNDDGPGTTVRGEATYRYDGDNHYSVDPEGLSCGSHGSDEDCEHRARMAEAAQAVLEARRPRSAPQDWETNTSGVASDLADDHARSEAARTRPTATPAGPSWSEDPEPFQAAYDAARARRDAGETPIPFMTENATNGLGDRDGGRGFGVELEFDVDPSVNRAAALQAIGRDLYDAGLTAHPTRQNWHAGVGSPHWRFEYDCTVDGEVISPILHDDPQSWSQLRQACEIIRRHGGRATIHTGNHIHVGVGDFDHTVENHNNLLGMFSEHEDTLYRLAMNPGARSHRGQRWCQPNRIPAEGYSSVTQVQYDAAHASALNFGSVHGNSTDHVEFRMWDGSLDPGTIQAQINLSLGLTHAAARAERGTIWGHEPIGLNRQRNQDLPRGGRLQGDRWRDNTAGFRRLVDRIFTRSANREQAASLFAVTHWQQPRIGARQPRTL